MKLDFENSTNELVDNATIEKLKSYKNILIFGAGDSGTWCYNLLSKNGISVSCFVDNYERKWGTEKLGKKIYSFDQAVSLYPNAAICVASMWFDDIIKQISEKDKNLLSHTFMMLSTMAWETTNKLYSSDEVDFINLHQDDFEDLSLEFADEKSRETLQGILNYRLTRKIGYIEEIKSDEITYFDKTLIPEKAYAGCIVDAGAFDGDTVETLISLKGNENNLNIHSIEMDSKNCDIFQSRDFPKKHKIVLHQNALTDKSGDLVYIESTGLSARKSSNIENPTCETIRIDDMNLSDVSFIKMDIEGAERLALMGGGYLVGRDKPVLTICAYHLQDDLLVLPKVIKSFNVNYDLYLRHYMVSSGDTILYAIPRG